MSTNQLYHTCFEQIRQLRPGEWVTRLRNLAWLMVGILKSRSVHLSRIANEIPGPAKEASLVRRLSRFLANPAVRVREWYEPIARMLLATMAQTVGEIRLIVDGTKVGCSHQLLMVSVAFRRRAIPIAWTWVRHSRGHSSGRKQKALLAYVHSLLPPDTPVLLVGDSEFGLVKVIRQLERWKWRYVLRQRGYNLVKLVGQSWQHFDGLVQRPGQSLWLGPGRLTEKHAYPAHFLAHWQKGEEKPWLLVTNLPTKTAALRAYRRRMWIEELYGDLKSNGFDLERSHLRHFARLSRLTLAAALLYVWLISTGARAIKNGQRHLVDRKDRRDLSVFQIGLRLIKRWLKNGSPISMNWCPVYGYKTKVSGS
jgi:hypothetical protein